MPDEFHVHQALLLDETFRPATLPPDQVFSAVDMNLYYNPRRPDWYKRPDWFAVLGVPRLYEGRESRLSYVVWQEEAAPLIVVELLSPRTQKEDLGQSLREVNQAPTKWEVYERILRVPYYAVFGRQADELRFFKLNGLQYAEVSGHGGRCWIPEAGLSLGLWQGEYKGQERLWLRWYDAQGHWLPTSDERILQERLRAEQERLRAEQERQRAEHERLRAEQERQRAERLAERLRQLGQDPDQF
jgi:Uma2 family endonuclease